MKKLLSLFCFLFCFSVLTGAERIAAAEEGKAKRPNIVFIFTDDHCEQALSAYDDSRMTTPNMDRIAKEGMRFNRCYVTNSICGPMRNPATPSALTTAPDVSPPATTRRRTPASTRPHATVASVRSTRAPASATPSSKFPQSRWKWIKWAACTSHTLSERWPDKRSSSKTATQRYTMSTRFPKTASRSTAQCR